MNHVSAHRSLRTGALLAAIAAVAGMGIAPAPGLRIIDEASSIRWPQSIDDRERLERAAAKRSRKAALRVRSRT